MKYIDADKLKAEIESISLFPQMSADYNDGRDDMKMVVLDLIDSLQQGQPEPVKGEFVFPKLLYARTLDNKTIDVSYGPQDMTAIEYVRNDFVEQEQPEVDLDEYIENEINHYGLSLYEASYGTFSASQIDRIIRNAFELGLKARKK